MSLLRLLSRLKDLEINFQLVDNHLKINAPKGKLTPILLNELRDKRGEIIEFLQEHVQTQGRKDAAIEPAEKQEYYALSSTQKRLYVLYRLEGGISYNMPSPLELEGRLDRDRLEEAFRRLIQRHESFRTSFDVVEDEPVQRIHDNVTFEIETIDSINNFVRTFDLSFAPLLRVGLIKTAENKHILMVDMHHIISDGMSIKILIKEFTALQKGDPLPELKLQYKDYSEWQQQEEHDHRYPAHQEYWLKEFAGEIPVLNLPCDYQRPVVQSFEGKTIRFELGKEETCALNHLADAANATLFMVLIALFNVLLEKLSGQEDIVVGTPVAGRIYPDLEPIIGMFVNTLALRNYPKREKTFSEFLEELKWRTLDAFTHQEYPLEDLIDHAAVTRDAGRSPLFDVMFALQNLELDELEAPGLKIRTCEYQANIAKFDMTLSVFEAEEKLIFEWEYCTRLFKEETTARFIGYFKNLVSFVLHAPGTRIEETEIISREETRRLLYDFNDTGSEYPKDKTIQQLFEEQVVQTPDHVAITAHSTTYRTYMTYTELNQKSNQLASLLQTKGVEPDSIIGLMVERSIEMIIGILGILKSGGAYLPIELDFPEERIKFMLADSRARILVSGVSRVSENIEVIDLIKIIGPIGPIGPILKELPTHPTQLCYVIYTSGTTGKPKGVLTAHYNVTRVVKNTNYIDLKKEDRLLQLSNYAFDGSVFDIYGALLNGAALVLVDREQVVAVDQLAALIKREQVTVFFVTTALFNTLVDLEIDCFANIRKVLFGGERVSVEHCRRALEYMGEGRILHVYGPTETTVYASYYFIDSIEKNVITIPIGKPISNTTVYILDKHLKPVPIGINGEVYLGGDGTARGYMNNPELTAEKFPPAGGPLSFSASQLLSFSIYRTGDLARWLQNGNIEFLGRIDHQVKLRGFRIELGEIESRLVKHNEIKEALVALKEDKRGMQQHLCAYLVSDRQLSVSRIREYLAKSLPDYMIPSYFVPLDKMPLKPNGKIDKKKLPEPEMTRGERYEAPGDDVEEKLVEIWAEVLNIDAASTGVNDDFFELGGHSLKATILVSKIHKEMEVKLPLVEIFRNPTVKNQAAYVKGTLKEKYVSIAPAAKKEYYTLSSAQKRLYILQQMDLNNIAYNMPQAVCLEGEFQLEEVDKKKLEDTIKQLIARHESLRTSFEVIESEPVQRIHNTVEFSMEHGANRFVRPFDLSRPPLLRGGLVETGDNRHLLLFDMHHIITDGTSQAILIREFKTLYSGKTLSPLKLQYKDYAEWQNTREQQESMKRQQAYWVKLFSDELPVLNLPTDYSRPLMQSFAGSALGFTVKEEETRKLKKIADEADTTLYMTLLAVFALLLSKLSGQEDVIVGTPIAARRHADLQHIIGMFVNTLAMRNYPTGTKTFKGFLQEVKKQTLEAYENQEYPFEDLVEKVSPRRDTSRNPVFDVMFSLQNLEEQVKRNVDDNYGIEHSIAKFDLSLEAVEMDNELLFHFEYCTTLFKKETIKRFIEYFKRIIASATNSPDGNISQIEMITGEEKNRILYDFNDTNTTYPGNKTIHELFEEQVERTPGNIVAHRTYRTYMTYKELNEKSNHLVRLLQEKGVEPDNIVGIMMEPAVEMIIGILGILKAGGAYLPIDPIYPAERITYMLKDSGAGILVSEVSGVSGDIEVIDLNNVIGPIRSIGPIIHRLPTQLSYVIYTSGSTGHPRGVMINHRSLVNLCDWHNRHFFVTAGDRAAKYAGFGFDASVWEIFPYLICGASIYIVDDEIKLDVSRLNDYFERYGITIAFLPTQVCEQFMEIESPSASLRILLTGGDKLNRFAKQHYRLVNNYGPTENTVVTTSFDVEKPYHNIPIGKPLTNNCIYILGRGGHLQPVGVPGELCVSGHSLARGYLNNPELTAEKFNRSYKPYRNYISYRTGDLARWLPDGNIEYLGRMDYQVKVRGFRIEPGEIETCLSGYDDIKEAVVLAKEEGSNRALYAYIVSEKEPTVSEIRAYLSQRLPDYMIPSYFVQVENIPLTSGGKVDRRALESYDKALASGIEYLEPRNDMEKAVADAWQEMLGLEKIGVNDNFFDSGGNSLKIVQLSFELKKRLARDIPVAKIFQYPTIASFAQYLDSVQDTGTAPKKQRDQTVELAKAKSRIKQRRIKGAR